MESTPTEKIGKIKEEIKGINSKIKELDQDKDQKILLELYKQLNKLHMDKDELLEQLVEKKNETSLSSYLEGNSVSNYLIEHFKFIFH